MYAPTNIRKTPWFKTKGQKEILRLKNSIKDQAVLGTIPRSIEGVKISPVEKHNLMKFFKHTELDGMTFEQRMVQIMGMASYQEGTDEFKALLMKRTWEGYMKVAKAALLADSEVFAKTGKLSRAVPGLIKYKRAKSLSYAASRKKARDKKRILGEQGDVLDVDDYSDEYGSAIGASQDELDNFFN